MAAAPKLVPNGNGKPPVDDSTEDDENETEDDEGRLLLQGLAAEIGVTSNGHDRGHGRKR